MRIHFERSGGFAGMIFEVSVETNDLPEEEAQAIGRLVENSNFFTLPSRFDDETPRSDQFQYKIMIETENQTHTVETSDFAAPQEMRPLLQKLTILARSGGSQQK
jgi:hypothetical protein